MVSSPEGLTSCSTYMSLLLDTVNMFRAVRVILRAAWAGKAKKKKKKSKTMIHFSIKIPFQLLIIIAQKKARKSSKNISYTRRCLNNTTCRHN